MNNLARGVIAICMVALVGLGFFSFTQFNTLNDTQNNLTDAQATGTEVANQLNDANTNIEQLTTDLDSANAEITEVVMNLDNANAEITEVVTERDLANAEITQMVDAAVMTATQSAEMMATSEAEITTLGSSVEALVTQNANIVSTATAQSVNNADAMSTASANATQGAESFSATATQSSADAQATVSSYSTAIADANNTIATQTSDLATTQAELDAQATPEPTDDANTSDDTDDEINIAPLKDGFALFEAEDFDLYVPDNYIVYDLRTDQDEAIEAFDKLGFAYDGIGLLAEIGNLYIVVGASDTVNNDGTLNNIVITSEVLPFAIDMEEYIELGAELFPESLEVVEQEILIIAGEEVGFMRTQLDDGIIYLEQLIYVYNVDGVIYSFAYTSNDIDENLADFEASLRSFTPDE